MAEKDEQIGRRCECCLRGHRGKRKAYLRYTSANFTPMNTSDPCPAPRGGTKTKENLSAVRQNVEGSIPRQNRLIQGPVAMHSQFLAISEPEGQKKTYTPWP
jgi:hypothetical protein